MSKKVCDFKGQKMAKTLIFYTHVIIASLIRRGNSHVIVNEVWQSITDCFVALLLAMTGKFQFNFNNK